MEKLAFEQQQFAVKHHNLVYKYLHTKHLPVKEFYDIIVFGYLRACQAYMTREDLQQFSFSTIAWSKMDTERYNHFRSQRCAKRSAKVLSLDYTDDKYTFSDIVEDSSADVLSEVCAEEFFDRFSDTQKQMLKMRAYGYNNGDIARKFKKPVNIVAKEISSLYPVALELMEA